MDMFEMLCNFIDTPAVMDEVVLNYVEKEKTIEDVRI